MQKSLKTQSNQLNRLAIETYKKIDKVNITLLLYNIRSAINVGSIFRTSDAFNIEKIILTGITACPPNKEILKSALGATESVEWEYEENALKFLNLFTKENNVRIVSVEQTNYSLKLDNFRPSSNEKYILIFGNEIEGVSQEIIDISDFCLEIPQFGTKHSLNVAVSAGIVLWDFHCKLNSQNTK